MDEESVIFPISSYISSLSKFQFIVITIRKQLHDYAIASNLGNCDLSDFKLQIVFKQFLAIRIENNLIVHFTTVSDLGKFRDTLCGL